MFLGGERVIKKTFDNSSTVLSAEYDLITKELTIVFSTGNTYQYSGIPEELVNDFFESKSPGSFVNGNIKKSSFLFKKKE